jgi:predicted Zn-dependent protease
MKLKETWSQLGRWWKTWKTVPVLEWVQAAALFRSGEYRLAEKFYRKGLKRHPQHIASHCARLDLAYCLFKSGKLAESEQELKLVTLNLPEMREAHLRLARLQLWRGHALDAAWTARRALKVVKPDAELVAIFLLAVTENEGPWYLLDEALDACKGLPQGVESTPKLQAICAYISHQRGEETGRETLEALCESERCPVEALVLLGKLLLADSNVMQGRRMLRRALSALPDNPQILALLAQSYLKSGTLYNADYARQLATEACQRSEWASPRELHILAEAYYHVGDKVSALIIASKAKEEGNRLLGSYRDVKSLEQLIDNLSAGTLA